MLKQVRNLTQNALQEKGFISEHASLTDHIRIVTDPEEMEGITGYISKNRVAILIGELGPDQHNAYWCDHALNACSGAIEGPWGIGVFNHYTLAIYRDDD